MKKNHRIVSLLLAALMAIGLMTTAFAAEPTINTGKRASLNIYKYDITTASADGAWDAESYVSTDLHDDAVIDKLARHKVNTRFIQKKPDGMGTWLAIFDNDGDVHAAISKRPDTTPLTGLLQEQGDAIFADCDSIALELDLEKETVKQTLRYAKKYGKKVFAVVSNMSIAMERRDFLQQIDCFVCNQQEAGLLFSDDYDHLSPDEMCRVLTGNVRSANIPSMVVTMGGQGAVYACADG